MYKSSKSTAGRGMARQQHSFAVAQTGINRERSSIDRPSRTLTAIDGAYIYPVLVDEVLPGDTFQLQMQIKGWLATPLLPFLDNLYISTFFFFVPNRLVWDNWKYFQGEKDNPGDTTTYSVPQIDILGGFDTGVNKLADYMGIPTIATTFEVNAMPFRGYNLIYNEFFRDTNLQDSVTEDKGDANSTEANHVLLKRGRRKDYLTGALPWPQRGTVEPGIISGVVPVQTTDTSILFEDESGNESTLTHDTTVTPKITHTGVPDTFDVGEALRFGSVTGLEANLATATANTINQLRLSVAIQHVLELDARAGTRLTEQIKARFGVTSADSRLQRPEYLGGGQVNVSMTPVPGTNQGPDPQDVGRLGAYGMVNGSAGGFTHSFTEHGYILGLVNLRADYTYSEGVPRHWMRTTRYDYYEPSFAHLGEQAVLNREIFVSNDSNDVATWGFQERFSEYKYGNSMVTSILRPNAFTSIAQWHLGEEFQTLPTLGAAFIVDNPPIDRVISVTSEPHFILDCYFSNRTTRVMPVFNTPGLTRL